jgi:hypothetical protein
MKVFRTKKKIYWSESNFFEKSKNNCSKIEEFISKKFFLLITIVSSLTLQTIITIVSLIISITILTAVVLKKILC